MSTLAVHKQQAQAALATAMQELGALLAEAKAARDTWNAEKARLEPLIAAKRTRIATLEKALRAFP